MQCLIAKYASHVAYIGQAIQDVNEAGVFGDSLIHLASFIGAIDDMRTLIQYGANINALGDLGNTPLHLAVLGNKIQAVKLLIENKAIVDITNEFGETAYAFAVLMQYQEIAQLFENMGQKKGDCTTSSKSSDRIKDFKFIFEGSYPLEMLQG